MMSIVFSHDVFVQFVLEILDISWNFIDAPGKFYCQLKYDNMSITKPNLVMCLNQTVI